MAQNIQLWINKDKEGTSANLINIILSNFKNIEIKIYENFPKLFSSLIEEPVDILLIDVSSNEFEGKSIFNEIRKIIEFKNIYLILAGTNNDYPFLLNTFDLGANDILIKPYSIESVIPRIKTALKYIELAKKRSEEYNLLQELAEQLEVTQKDEVELISRIASLRLSLSNEAYDLIEGASTWMIDFLESESKEDLNDLQIASRLSYLGRIILPDRLITLPIYIDGNVSDPLMYQIPTAAYNLICNFPWLQNAADILYHIYENMDGTGFPDKLQSWQIPLKSRILRVVLDYYDIIRCYNIKSSDALAILKKYSNQLYDNRVIILFEQYILSVLKLEGELDEIPLALQNLQPGMQLTREIYTNNGLKLLNAGSFLTEAIINKLIYINTTDPILGFIYVKK
ncbi:MAG TPA: HD domain-containing phosphohydrolase [Bacteroidota bacterium]|nr:HD domain-containing phosphohydrolase [Candidatus Kapabacteria bacterium]HRS00981.1 HD domain-containing phosphohydrolase [Bacteroidota bacterium]HRT67332.1 HD domain-containing phosphohydrolase [Bacteroidota bacterium]